MESLQPDDLEILHVHYDESHTNCEPCTFPAIVLRTAGRRRKLLYVYQKGIEDMAWITPKASGRWTERTYGAIVDVEDANESQRAQILSRISLERLQKIFSREPKAINPSQRQP